jgi:hypothetical protein
MPDTQDAFDVVIAALTAQRDKIDQTISTIRQLKDSGFTSAGAALDAAEALNTPLAEIKDPSSKLGPGAFLGLTIVDAAKKLLAHERRQLNNGEIAEALKRGGLVLNSADVLNTIGSVMNRRFLQVGDVVRVGRGTWGLKEWYPNRSFKTAPKAEAVPSATAQEDDERLSAMLDELANSRDEPDDEAI